LDICVFFLAVFVLLLLEDEAELGGRVCADLAAKRFGQSVFAAEGGICFFLFRLGEGQEDGGDFMEQICAEESENERGSSKDKARDDEILSACVANCGHADGEFKNREENACEEKDHSDHVNGACARKKFLHSIFLSVLLI